MFPFAETVEHALGNRGVEQALVLADRANGRASLSQPTPRDSGDSYLWLRL